MLLEPESGGVTTQRTPGDGDSGAVAALGCGTRDAQGWALPFCPHPQAAGGERGLGMQQNCSEKGSEAGEEYGTRIL